MKQDNIVQTKSYSFAVKIVTCYKSVVQKEKEYVLSKQLLRCGTSIGANVEEGIGGQTKKDFIAKISIAYKEARETRFWLRLMYDTGFLEEEIKNDLMQDCEELIRILVSILKSSKESIPTK